MNPLLLPVVAAQGIWVRYRTEVLPPAGGPSTGTAGADRTGAPMRIAVLGESTAAGCGVDTHDDGFAGGLARELVERAGRPVRWAVVGQHGATARRIRHKLLSQLGDGFDLAVLLAGANDVLNRRSTEDWRDDLTVIVDDLTDRAKHVVVVGMPPFASFPSLPGTLGRYLAGRAALLDAVSAQVCAQRSRASFLSTINVMPVGGDFFARDRFHPSSNGYQRWAHLAAQNLPD